VLKFRFIFCLLILISFNACSSETDQGKLNAIKSLYSYFSPATSPKSPTISNQNLANLNKFFNKNLASLIAKDNECAKKEGVCKLEFDPIYSSQDDENAQVTIKQIGEDVFADIAYPEQKVVQIKFELVKESQIYKISNISYTSKKSLVEILQR